MPFSIHYHQSHVFASGKISPICSPRHHPAHAGPVEPADRLFVSGTIRNHYRWRHSPQQRPESGNSPAGKRGRVRPFFGIFRRDFVPPRAKNLARAIAPDPEVLTIAAVLCPVKQAVSPAVDASELLEP